MSKIKEMMDQFISDGVLTQEEHDQFMEMVHKDGEIDAIEREQISRMFRLMQEGKLRIVNDHRDKVDRNSVDTHKKEASTEDELRERERQAQIEEVDEEERAARQQELSEVIQRTIEESNATQETAQQDSEAPVEPKSEAKVSAPNSLLARAKSRYEEDEASV